MKDNPKYLAYIDDEGEDLQVTLQKGLEFIGWDKYIDRNSRVFVKPNFTLPYYKEGVTTNPDFLRCLLQILKSRAATVIVGESDGGMHSFKAEEAFEGHNMHQICHETGVELVSLSRLPSRFVEGNILGKRLKVQLPNLLLDEVDCFISVPVLKVHVVTTVSLSLKNSWGCVPDTMRGLHHHALAYKLALIAKLLKPKIVVIDGTYGLNKHGPMYGEPIKTNLALMADNTVVADTLGAMIMGFSPHKMKQIAVAEKAGIGSIDVNDVELNKDWKQYQRQFQIKKTIVDRVSILLFDNDFASRIIADSPLTTLIYKVASLVRSEEENELASKLGKPKRLLPY